MHHQNKGACEARTQHKPDFDLMLSPIGFNWCKNQSNLQRAGLYFHIFVQLTVKT